MRMRWLEFWSHVDNEDEVILEFWSHVDNEDDDKYCVPSSGFLSYNFCSESIVFKFEHLIV